MDGLLRHLEKQRLIVDVSSHINPPDFAKAILVSTYMVCPVADFLFALTDVLCLVASFALFVRVLSSSL